MAAEFWQQWEDDVLASLYPLGGTARCVKALPNRTARSIRCRAIKLKLRSANGSTPWTPVELALIKRLYPAGGAEEVVGYMPNRTANSIRQQACLMKVARISAYSHPHSKTESPVPLPAAHEYAPEDHAWMATRLPVYGGGFGAAVIGRAAA